MKKESAEENDTKGMTIKKSEDLSEWYSQIVQKAELADYAPVKGFMVIRPSAYAIWERIQEYFNAFLKSSEVKNAYFPLLIPESFFKKEAKHAEGFAPELAYIEGKEEGERVALRPTSETIIYDSYSKWVRSWRDLPLKINQWCNVLRWEVKQTKPFLRTREFLWQEGHCVFETEEEAEKDMHEIILEYKKMIEEMMAIPVIVGKKSTAEKFAGARTTMTAEAIMPDGKSLQMGTSHNLGQGFAKVFNIRYKGRDGREHIPWQTSWGFSTRLVGAIAMVHGDDKGLVLPPNIAQYQGVIVPIFKRENQKEVLGKCREISNMLKGYRVIVDSRDSYSPGWKFSEWELKGIPVRMEIGLQDIKKRQVTVIRRDNGKRESVPEKHVQKRFNELLKEIQNSLYSKAKKSMDSKFDSARSMKELKEKIGKRKVVRAYMVDDIEVERKIKEETGGAASRIIEESGQEGVCVQTGKKTKTIAYFAKSY